MCSQIHHILYDCNDGFQIGAIESDEAIRKLQALGYDLEEVPILSGIVGETCILEEDEMQWWVYIIRQHELSEDFYNLRKKPLDKERAFEERMMQEDE